MFRKHWRRILYYTLAFVYGALLGFPAFSLTMEFADDVETWITHHTGLNGYGVVAFACGMVGVLCMALWRHCCARRALRLKSAEEPGKD